MASGEFTLNFSLNGTTDDGTSYNISGSKAYTGVTDAVKEELTVPTSTVDIFKIDTNPGAGQLNDLKGIVIQNLDTTNFITVGVLSTAGTEAFFVRVKAKGVLILDDKSIEGVSGATSFTAFADLSSINAIADTAACKVSVLAIK